MQSETRPEAGHSAARVSCHHVGALRNGTCATCVAIDRVLADIACTKSDARARHAQLLITRGERVKCDGCNGTGHPDEPHVSRFAICAECKGTGCSFDCEGCGAARANEAATFVVAVMLGRCCAMKHVATVLVAAVRARRAA